jgi:hypothetical protein
VTSGFLFGVWLGAAASGVGATAGASIIFLVARTTFGEPLLARAGPRLAELARGSARTPSAISCSCGWCRPSLFPGQSGAGLRRGASGAADCMLAFNARDALMPEVIGALAALGLLAMLPAVVKRWRARRARPSELR